MNKIYLQGGTLGLVTSYVQGSALPNDGITAKIASLEYLTKGWRYGQGGPISRKVIDTAFAILTVLKQFLLSDIDAFAGSDGEIALIASYNKFDIEVIIEDSGAISVICDYNRKQIAYQTQLSYQDAVRKISMIMREAWNTFGCFTLTTTITRGGDLPALRSGTMGAAFPSSITIVYNQHPQVYPSILGHTTTILAEIQSRSGSSRLQSSQLLTV